jgi:L-threonylcarbamoyladenylate synthase
MGAFDKVLATKSCGICKNCLIPCPMTRILAPTKDNIEVAAHAILAGQLVAFPTETVYGLGANALDGQAVARIFAAKGRPSFNPLISHASDMAMLVPHVEFDERARQLAAHFWPGPLTLILPRNSSSTLSELVSAGLPTAAVRIPDHPVALDLIRAAGVPIAAPSANRSGTLSPTSPHYVAESLGEAVDIILAGGPSKVGLESTVVDLSGPETLVLRPGAITAEDIGEVLGCLVSYHTETTTEFPRSPGQLLCHYTPARPVRLRAVDVERGEALLAFGSTKFMGIRGGGKLSDLPQGSIKNLSESGDLFEAAANLFAYLHALDTPEHSRIAVMDIPRTGIGFAINDRLTRAAGE